jgi:hypothetical protein
MAQLVVSAAAAAVGFVIGGPTGAQIGWTVGGLLVPPKGPDGPRLEDLKAQVASYGNPIPRIYGTFRTAGSVIWASDLVEREVEQGGKGGSSYSTYAYSCSFALLICDRYEDGPIAGVSRIWFNGKLVYDVQPANTGPVKDWTASGFRVYTGTEDQEPDPAIEVYEGVAPAYRGMAYLVWEDLDLQRYGNTLPQVSVEVVTHGVVGRPLGSNLASGTMAAAARSRQIPMEARFGSVQTTAGRFMTPKQIHGA